MRLVGAYFLKVAFAVFVLLLLPTARSYGARIELTPEFPEPNKQVVATIKLEPGEYISGSNWFLDGKPVAQDTDEITVIAPNAGQSAILKVAVQYPNSAPKILRKKISPVHCKILYEADTFAPDFMPVASVNSVGSTIKALAQVKVPEYKTEDLIFVWKKDGVALNAISGKNKTYANITPDFFAKTTRIGLDVKDPTGIKLLAHKEIYIAFQDPTITLYGEDELTGWTFTRALGAKVYGAQGVQALAIPFNMSVQSIFSPLINWVWYVNGASFETKANSPFVEIVFSSPSAKFADILVTAQYKKHVLQKAQKMFRIFRDRTPESAPVNTSKQDGSTQSGFGI